MTNFNKVVKENGGLTLRVSKWSTINYTAVKGDEADGLVVGQKYVIWIANMDCTTNSGNPVAKGDYFAVLAK